MSDNFTPTPIDSTITNFIAGKPWLKFVLAVMTALLGAARGRQWFNQRYIVK